MSDSTLSTLSKIRIKVRRLTRNPSISQLSDADIDSYVNSFILYDMPAYVKLDTLKEVFTFFTSPYVDTYQTNTTDPNDPLYNFKNKYTNVGIPVYIAGVQSLFSQSLDEFYSIYPQNNYKESLGTGNGVTTQYTGTLTNVPFMENKVIASSIDINNNPLEAYDNGSGTWTGDVSAVGSIVYRTGVYDITFSTAPKSGEEVWIQTIPYTISQPLAVLYFQNKFIVRPIPDATYRIDIQAYRRPTELINGTDMPELSEWWEYIAEGASIKLLQDRLDVDGVNMIMPQFKNHETLIGRRKIVQNAGKRTATIYSDLY